MPKGVGYKEQQAETEGSTMGNDPYLSTGDGKHLKMPGAGVVHGGPVHLDQVTRSDSNTGA